MASKISSSAVLVRRKPYHRPADKEKKDIPQPQVLIHPSSGLIAQAILALRNNSTTLSEETKSGTIRTVSFNADVLATLRAAFRSTMGYRFQCHQNGTLSTSGIGVLASSLPINNTTGPTISEWAALAALFDEVKAIRTTLGLTTSYGPTATVAINAIPYVIAFDHVNSSASAPGFGNVQRLAESKVIHNAWMDRGSGRHVQRVRIAKDRLFGLTAAPTSTSSDIGLNGQWDVVGQNTTTVSSILAYFDIESVFLFRNRA